jgi:carbonic anhydrase
VHAALHDLKFGLIDNWLRHVQDVVEKHADLLSQLTDDTKRLETLCELNVIEQACNVAQTTIVRQAWERGQELAVHGWIYSLHDGLLRDLHVELTDRVGLEDSYRRALAALSAERR